MIRRPPRSTRTDTLFPYPALLLAKALGGGMPLGAFIASGEIMNTLSHDPVLGHITTFGGHPVSCSAGLAALEVLLEEDLITGTRQKGNLFRELLQHPSIRSEEHTSELQSLMRISYAV